MKKQNCWEFMKCGRERATADQPACPVATAMELDGVNGGRAGGRCCWGVVGTVCHAAVQGQFVAAHESCLECSFFKSVSRSEWPGLVQPDADADAGR